MHEGRSVGGLNFFSLCDVALGELSLLGSFQLIKGLVPFVPKRGEFIQLSHVKS